MIAVDTNILVCAHRRDSAWHDAAYARIAALAEGRLAWCIPWNCLHEFVAVVTHPRIYAPPSRLAEAIDQIEAWLAAPTVTLLSETDGYWPLLKRLLQEGRIAGPIVHDARVAAICLLHGVSELWTADRDFGRFADLVVRNPLVA
ncbi:MAG TPA: TA system VapC family ribonuclease toxin [Casimicrobiaceae bacterium]